MNKCESCKYYQPDAWQDKVCTNNKSDKHGIETEHDDRCAEWEGKE